MIDSFSANVVFQLLIKEKIPLCVKVRCFLLLLFRIVTIAFTTPMEIPDVKTLLAFSERKIHPHTSLSI